MKPNLTKLALVISAVCSSFRQMVLLFLFGLLCLFVSSQLQNDPEPPRTLDALGQSVHVGATEDGSAEIGAEEVGVAEVGSEVGAEEVGIAEVGSEVGAEKVGVSEVGARPQFRQGGEDFAKL
jgi:hypothetical protein